MSQHIKIHKNVIPAALFPLTASALLCMLVLRLESCKHESGEQCPLDLQFEEEAVDLIEGLKIHQANFISLQENQYCPVSYLPAQYPRQE